MAEVLVCVKRVPQATTEPVITADGLGIDATIRMVDAKAAGEYNATGPKNELTMGPVLDSCKKVAKSDVFVRHASVLPSP